MKKLVFWAFVVGAIYLVLRNEDSTQATETASRPQPVCEVGEPASGEVIGVVDDFEVRVTPSEEGERIVNQRATEALKSTVYRRIDSSTTVQHLCIEGDWSHVKIATPERLSHVEGWVPNTVLRQIERTASGDRIYVESDFYWDDDTSDFKPEIVAIVNKIVAEHSGCTQPDTGTLIKSPSHSQPRDPVFSITCGSGAQSFNVRFRTTDTDRTFSAPRAISRIDAVEACEREAKAAASHPSTVDFSRVLSVSFSERPDGTATLMSRFSAKNAFNLELNYQIRCLFEGKRLVERMITEAQ